VKVLVLLGWRASGRGVDEMWSLRSRWQLAASSLSELVQELSVRRAPLDPESDIESDEDTSPVLGGE